MPKPSALALAAVAVLAPVAAHAADPTTGTAAAPAACAGKAPVLKEGERLVEHKLFLHGTSPVGNVDQVQDFAALGLSDKKSMTATPPTGTQSKVDALTIGTNAAFAGNPNMAYWVAAVAESQLEQVIVCAEATWFGQAQGAMRARIYADGTWGSVEPTATAPVTGPTAPGATPATYTVNFGKLAAPVSSSLLFQLEPTSVAAVHYDSTVAPSTFTYVTLERPFAEEE